MNILDARNLFKCYNSKDDKIDILKDISLNMETSEMVAVMGPSGSGKTTLLNLLSGIDKSDSGEITIGGTNTSNLKKSEMALFRRKNLGLVFQDFNLLDCLNVRENILLPMALENTEIEDQNIRLEKIAEILCIEKILDKKITDISGGERQRAAIARAIVNDPAVIFADEPTGNLDSKSTKDVMEYFVETNEKLGTGILMVTHDTFAASYFQRVVLLKDGEIISELTRHGTRKQFFHEILELLELIGGDSNDI